MNATEAHCPAALVLLAADALDAAGLNADRMAASLDRADNRGDDSAAISRTVDQVLAAANRVGGITLRGTGRRHRVDRPTYGHNVTIAPGGDLDTANALITLAADLMAAR
jgi:hypothetical protein